MVVDENRTLAFEAFVLGPREDGDLIALDKLRLDLLGFRRFIVVCQESKSCKYHANNDDGGHLTVHADLEDLELLPCEREEVGCQHEPNGHKQ